MIRYLLDTNAVSAMIDRRQPLLACSLEAKRRGGRIGTCEPVVAEHYYGLERSSSRDLNIMRLEHALHGFTCWPFSRQAAKEYGRIAAFLRRTGRPIQTIDIMIAAIALTVDNCTVVTTDSDFAAIPGLDVIDWTLPNQGAQL